MSEQTNTDTFWGVEMWDATNPNDPYFTQVNVKQSLSPEINATELKPVNMEYPILQYNTKQHPLRGSVTGDWSDNKTDPCNIDWTNTQFKLTFSQWIRNKRTKYLKLSNSLIIPVGILSETYDIEASIDDNITTSVTFEWVQLNPSSIDIDLNIYCPICDAVTVPNAHYCYMCGAELT